MEGTASLVQAWKTFWKKGSQSLVVKSSRKRSRKIMGKPGRGPKGVMSGVYMWAHKGFGTRASCARIGGWI